MSRRTNPRPRPQWAGRAVLAVLVVEAGRVVPVDALVVDRVWGERPPVSAKSALRAYLSRLRRALDPTRMSIPRRGAGYLLDIGPDVVDSHRSHRLVTAAREHRDPRRALALVEDALALWRGEPLAELDTEWAQAVRERLRHERAAAEADRIDGVLTCGRHHELLPELTALAAEVRELGIDVHLRERRQRPGTPRRIETGAVHRTMVRLTGPLTYSSPSSVRQSRRFAEGSTLVWVAVAPANSPLVTSPTRTRTVWPFGLRLMVSRPRPCWSARCSSGTGCGPRSPRPCSWRLRGRVR